MKLPMIIIVSIYLGMCQILCIALGCETGFIRHDGTGAISNVIDAQHPNPLADYFWCMTLGSGANSSTYNGTWLEEIQPTYGDLTEIGLGQEYVVMESRMLNLLRHLV